MGNFHTLLLEKFPNAIIAIAPGSSILYWNCGAEAIFGYARVEASGTVRNSAGSNNFILYNRKNRTDLKARSASSCLMACYGDPLESTPDSIVMVAPLKAVG